MAVINKCHDCPITKEYLDMGGCPNCKAKKLPMSTRTHMATCNVCGVTFGIPMAIEGMCYTDKCCKRYIISIASKLNKEQLLVVSKLMGLNGVEVYQLFKNNNPVVFRDVPMIVTYELQSYLRSIGTTMKVNQDLDEYPLFEQCWKIQQW